MEYFDRIERRIDFIYPYEYFLGYRHKIEI